MKKLMAKACCGLMLASALVGCGSDDAGTNLIEEVKFSAKEPDMMRTWETANCKETKFFDASMREYYEFAGNDFRREMHFFDTGTCSDTNSIARINYNGRIDLGDKNAALEDARDVTFKYESAFVEPLNEKGVDILNAADFCGINDWKLNEKRDITQQTSDTLCPVLDIPNDYHNLVKVDGDKLYLGKENSEANNPTDRPTELDKEGAFQHSTHNLPK